MTSAGGTQVPELISGASGLGWVAIKAVLLFAVAVIGLRLGERRTLAQLSAFDFAVAVAIGSIIGRGATAPGTSFASSAIALVTFLVAHRIVAILRRHSQIVRLIDHPPRVLVAHGELKKGELARAGLTAADVYALLRENGVSDLGQVGYLLYETSGAVTVIGPDREPGCLMRDGLNAAGYGPAGQAGRARQGRSAACQPQGRGAQTADTGRLRTVQVESYATAPHHRTPDITIIVTIHVVAGQHVHRRPSRQSRGAHFFLPAR